MKFSPRMLVSFTVLISSAVGAYGNADSADDRVGDAAQQFGVNKFDCALAQSIVSSFDTGLDGWTIVADGTPSWQRTSGNPGGWMRVDDNTTGEYSWAKAPAEFLGNWSSMCAVSVDLRMVQSTAQQSLKFEISGPGGAASYDSGVNPTSSWSPFAAPLISTSWQVTVGSWDALIVDVRQLLVTSAFAYGDEACGIDNISLVKFEPQQWTQTNGGNNHCYVKIDVGATWDGARALASQMTWHGVSGHLATITSEEEDAWLSSNLDLSKEWLGGIQTVEDIEPDVGWTWITGEPWSYTNWSPGEPNDGWGGTENRLMEWDGGRWNDARAIYVATGYIVEFDLDEQLPAPWPNSVATPRIRIKVEEAVACMVVRVEFEGSPPFKSSTTKPFAVQYVDGFATMNAESLAEYFLLYGSDIDRIKLYSGGISPQLVGHIDFNYTRGDYEAHRGVDAYLFVHNDELPMTPANARDWSYKADGWDYYEQGEYPVSMLIPPEMSILGLCDDSKTPVLFVHGINTWFDNCWGNVPELVNSHTYDCWRFEYPHDSAIDKNSRLLGLAVDRVLHGGIPGHTGYSSDRIALVTHSMGGLVARQYIQSTDYFQRGAVSKLLMFGTPNHGSYSSYRARYRRDFLTGALDGLHRNDAAAPAHEMMTPGSPFLVNLNALAPRPLGTGIAARDYLVVAGVQDYPIPGVDGLTLRHREIFRQDDGFVAAASAGLLEWGIPLALSNRHHINLKLPDASNDAAGIIETFLSPSYNPTFSTPNLPNAVYCFLDDFEDAPCRDDHNVDDELGILEFRILNSRPGVSRYRIDLPSNQSVPVMDLTANAGGSLGWGNRFLQRIGSDGDEFFSLTQRQALELEIAFWGQEGTYDLRVFDGATHMGTFPDAVVFHHMGTASATIALSPVSCLAINAPNQSRLTPLKAAQLGYEYTVDATVDTLVFSLSSETSPADFSQHDFRLVDPNGRTIDVATALADPALDVFENTEYGPIQYLIPNPVPGTWRLQHDDSVPAPAVHAYLYAGFRATLAVVGHEHAAGDSLVCRVTVSGAADCTTQNQGLTLALTRPGETAPVNLGPAPLIDLGGGQFEAVIGDLESGQYRLTLDVACQDSELGSLVRTAVLDVWVDRAADDVSSVHDDDPQQSPAVDVPMRIRSAAPNPFNPQTTIAYEIPARQAVRMAIYDLSGRLVRRLLESEVQEAGSYEVVWNGRSDNGTIMPSGVYFCRVEAGGRVQTIKLALLK